MPVVVLIESDPWLMVVGSDVPTFALYQNGQIIYKKAKNNSVTYYEVTLDHDEAQKVVKTLGITDSLMSSPPFATVSDATDQPTNELVLNFDSVTIKRIYGNLRPAENRKKAPGYFSSVYERIIAFDDNERAKPWLPDSVEVMLTGYSHSPEKPKAWPAEWPDLNNNTTVKRSSDLYSLYLDKKYFKDFLKLAASLKEKQGVILNGQIFSLSYRLPFPNIR